MIPFIPSHRGQHYIMALIIITTIALSSPNRTFASQEALIGNDSDSSVESDDDSIQDSVQGDGNPAPRRKRVCTPAFFTFCPHHVALSEQRRVDREWHRNNAARERARNRAWYPGSANTVVAPILKTSNPAQARQELPPVHPLPPAAAESHGGERHIFEPQQGLPAAAPNQEERSHPPHESHNDEHTSKSLLQAIELFKYALATYNPKISFQSTSARQENSVGDGNDSNDNTSLATTVRHRHDHKESEEEEAAEGPGANQEDNDKILEENDAILENHDRIPTVQHIPEPQCPSRLHTALNPRSRIAPNSYAAFQALFEEENGVGIDNDLDVKADEEEGPA